MPTSSITKNFVVSGEKQAQTFADAIEESYHESLQKKKTPDMKITHLRGSEAVKQFMSKREDTPSVNYRELKDPEEIRELMKKWKKMNN